MDTNCQRPALRYFGGKWKLAPWVIAQFPEHAVYCEPFGGAASVLIRKPRSSVEIYNDLDGEVVNVFRMIRDRGDELIEKLRLTPFAREEFETSQLPALDPMERARRTIFLSMSSFSSNGLRKGKKSGFRNEATPRRTTARDWSSYPDHLAAIIDRFAGVLIERRPALDVMVKHDSRATLHYVDPPYVWASRQWTAGHGYSHEMDEDQHRELAECLKSLSGKVIISGYATELYEDLFSDWRRIERRHFRQSRTPAQEVLWISPNAEAIGRAQQLLSL